MKIIIEICVKYFEFDCPSILHYMIQIIFCKKFVNSNNTTSILEVVYKEKMQSSSEMIKIALMNSQIKEECIVPESF